MEFHRPIIIQSSIALGSTVDGGTSGLKACCVTQRTWTDQAGGDQETLSYCLAFILLDGAAVLTS